MSVNLHAIQSQKRKQEAAVMVLCVASVQVCASIALMCYIILLLTQGMCSYNTRCEGIKVILLTMSKGSRLGIS